MKTLLLIPLLVIGGALAGSADEATFATKQIIRKFGNVAEANQWRLNILPFKEWLKAVTFPDFQLLHASKTEEFYFAVFRSKGQLIFWHTDRQKRYSRSYEQITDDAGRSATGKGDSRLVLLQFKLESPGAALEGQESGSVSQIKDGLHGDLTIRFRVGSANEPATHQVLEQAVPWTK